MPDGSGITRRRFLATSLAGLAAVEWPSAEGMPRDHAAVQDALALTDPAGVRLQGYVGEKIDLDLRNRVMAQDIHKLVKPFFDQTEVGDGDWRNEYWGKWITSAVEAYDYEPSPERRAVVERGVSELLPAQNPDGYIGTRSKASRLHGWDVWGRKYVLLGLLACYDMTGSRTILNAARRHEDSLLAEVGPEPGKANIAEVSYQDHQSLPSCSVLEPTVLLYRRTGDPRYLRFAEYIVGQWSRPNRFNPTGIRLVEKATVGAPPSSIANGKAYEMTSCFEGLAELYRATGKPEYLEACRRYADGIVRDELFVVGSGSSREVWFGGRSKQTQDNPDPMETCVTATWMKYCLQLLRLTGDSRYADQMEISLYNALLGALKPDGSWWGYYTPMQGIKRPSGIQHADVGLSCCVANGPRALMLTPQWAVMASGRRQESGLTTHDSRLTTFDGVVVNVYCPGTATARMASGRRVRIEQETEYPVTDQVRLTVRPERPATFTLSLRIPEWSERNALEVNGRPADVELRPGSYAAVRRPWKPGDTVTLTLDLRGRVLEDPGKSGAVAVLRGPIVLAMDRRLVKDDGGRRTEDRSGIRLINPQPSTFNQMPDGRIELKQLAAPAGIWMAFEAPCSTEGGGEARLPLCDYASAGNTWGRDSEFRVWLPQPLEGFGSEAVSLQGASWIWFAGDRGARSQRYAPAEDLPAGTRYFRRVLEVPSGIRRARITLTADDGFVLYVNGEEVGQAADWGHLHTFDITRRLRAGRNVIAVAATNASVSPAGLIAGIELLPAGGRPVVLLTGADWKSAENSGANWQAVEFDDSVWSAARVLGPFGMAPWGDL